MDKDQTKRDESHRQEIVEQFSRQAIPFAQVPGHLDALGLLVEMAQATQGDAVLDVACGPGLVACEFARHCGQVTGIDLTPAMIEQARKRQEELRIPNLRFLVGDAVPLPYGNDSFSLVITRYSLHHFTDPEQVLSEMIRVCRPGGRVLVADVAVDPEKAAAYDRMELMRDSSHTHALTTVELAGLFARSGLRDCRQSAYGVDIGLASQLRASFPAPGDEERLREMITADIGCNRLGIDARRVEGEVVYTVPIGVYVGAKG